jgi:hypothetical protein
VHHAHAEATWQAPYRTLTGELWVHFIPGVVPIPLGIFDHEDDEPLVSSIRVPDGDITRWIRDTTRFIERIEDALPGSKLPFVKQL